MATVPSAADIAFLDDYLESEEPPPFIVNLPPSMRHQRADPFERSFVDRGNAIPGTSTYKTYYYTGGQAQIYMRDVFLDEVTSLQFSTVTNKTPIFGYASRRFDTVAAGNMLVQGTFTINFVSSGYLQIIAQSIQDKNRDSKSSAAKGILKRHSDIAKDPYLLNQTINQIRGLGNQEFRAYSLQLLKSQRGAGKILQFYDIPPFDIFAVFGDSHDPNANSTTRNIKEVYLTGQSQVVSTGGEVLQEQYSFIAKDID